MATYQQERLTNNAEVAKKLLDLKGMKGVDVGCGEGRFTRFLASQGADMHGIDVNDKSLDKARAALDGENVTFQNARGEDMPFDDGSLDLVVFSNSFHHIASDKMATALGEALRVLKPGGLLYVMEPVAEGNYFEGTRLINDESTVRAEVYELIQDAEAHGFETVDEITYTSPRRFESYEAFRDHQVSRSAERQALFDSLGDEIRVKFLAHALPDEGGFVFNQIFRVNLLRKSA
ncbi:MAG: class I SAM-dependent methyltransferase [Alphaproteobacteria bacterium]